MQRVTGLNTLNVSKAQRDAVEPEKYGARRKRGRGREIVARKRAASRVTIFRNKTLYGLKFAFRCHAWCIINTITTSCKQTRGPFL